MPTSATADWELITSVLAAAAATRVAVLTAGTSAPPGARLSAHVATWAALHDGARVPLRLADALKVVDALAHTHDLVLTVGAAGLVEPMGRTGWTVADLAAALGAPVVAAVGADPRGINFTTVEAVRARGLPAALVTVGGAPVELPLEPSGRIPAGVGGLDPETARGFLDPALHARPDHLPRTAPRPPAARPGATRATGGTGGWPERGPWVVVPATATVDWEPAVTALAAASTARVAVVVIGAAGPPAGPLTAHLATWVGLRHGERDPLRAADALAVIGALGRTHKLVLVVEAGPTTVTGGVHGDVPGVPELAAALRAPVVVVAGDDAESAGAAGRARDAIGGHGLPAAIVTVADGPIAGPPRAGSGPPPTGDGPLTGPTPEGNGPLASPPPTGDGPFAGPTPEGNGPLASPPPTGDGPFAGPTPEGNGRSAGPPPVTSAGRVPAGGDLDADAARALLDPMLHAAAPRVAPPAPARRVRVPTMTPRSRAGTARSVLLLVAIFLVMSLSAVTLAYCNRTPADPGSRSGLGTPAPAEIWRRPPG